MNIISFLRQFRIGQFAIFDFALAFFGILLVSPLLFRIFMKIGIEIPRRSWLFFTLPIAIIVHLLIGRMTPMTKEFLDINGHYLLKIIILGSFILGLISIKRIK
jgi:hypothetical protein